MSRAGSQWSIAYFVVYFGGIAGLAYMTRAFTVEPPALFLPFALPVILVAIAALVARAEAGSESDGPQESTSMVGRTFLTIRREPRRATTVLAFTLITPFSAWVYPRDAGGSRVRVMFQFWWLVLAAFTGLVLPRLLRMTHR
jgi:hypothetical protein